MAKGTSTKKSEKEEKKATTTTTKKETKKEEKVTKVPAKSTKAKGKEVSKVAKPKTKAVVKAKAAPKSTGKTKLATKPAKKPVKEAKKPAPKPKKTKASTKAKADAEDSDDSLDSDEFEVEEIRACKTDLGKKFYLVKWVVFDEDEKTWEPEDNIFSKELITNYEAKQGNKPVWQYYLETSVDGKRPGWHNYDSAAGDEVEKSYQEWTNNPVIDVRSVTSGSWNYRVDFNLMTQMNLGHCNHTVRHIRRFVPSS